MEKVQTQEEKAFFEVADGVWGLTDIFTNVYVIENKDENTWVLVDAGLKTAYPKIKKMVNELFR